MAELLPAIGVCGYGRCGSTMAMQMLAAGGVPLLPGAELPPHEVPFASLHHRALAGHAVKLLDSPGYRAGLPPAPLWRFVWLDRNPLQQALSHLKFLATMGRYRRTSDEVERFAAEAKGLARSYQADRPRLLTILRGAGEVLVWEYERVLANPRKAAKALAALWPGFDVAAAAAAVHKRDGLCLPDLSVEVEAVPTQFDPSIFRRDGHA